jgi:hypothetical protein
MRPTSAVLVSLPNADYDGDEDDRGDHHAHQLHEPIAQRLHLHGDLRIEVAEQRPRDHRDDDLDVEGFGSFCLYHATSPPEQSLALLQTDGSW